MRGTFFGRNPPRAHFDGTVVETITQLLTVVNLPVATTPMPYSLGFTSLQFDKLQRHAIAFTNGKVGLPLFIFQGQNRW